MPALATATPPTSSPTESISASASPVSFESLIKADTAEAGLASGARRAVESAVAMAERFSNADRSSVNLQFNVSGVDLAVRVQMKADGVHTTFRTDSPELRAALAQEWHSVAAQTPDRAVRLADPTFSSHTSDSSLQSDAGSRHDRDSSARNSQSFSDQFSSARGGARLPSSVAPVISTAPVATSASGRLHAFA